MARYTVDNRPAPVHFEMRGDFIGRTLQNVKNLLRLKMGEIPYDRYRGMDPELLSAPKAELEERIMREVDRVLLWEPDAVAVSCECMVRMVGEPVITVTVDIAGEGA